MPIPKGTKRNSFAAAARAVAEPELSVEEEKQIETYTQPKEQKIKPGSKPRLQIPIIDRANYVAYLRIVMAIEQLRYVPLMAQGVDRVMLEDIIKRLNKLVEGPYTAIGMDKEHIEGLSVTERFPEDREQIDRRQSVAASPNAKPSPRR